MFRRTKSPASSASTGTADSASVVAPVGKEGGKGRPTPTRREAQAAAKARARAPRDKKAARQVLRERRSEQRAKYREGMRTGDDRYLMARDQGPVRRFVRDFVDSRICMAEFMLPLLIAVMALQASANPSLLGFSNGLWLVTMIVIPGDTLFFTWRLKRALRERFPDESHKGAVFYAILRALQLRFLRLPKPKVKLGQPLPERY